MGNVLETELGTYALHRDSLVGSAEGRFVLIHKDRVCGLYDTEGDAIAQGYAQLGNVPFLVKQVTKVDVPMVFTSHLLGI